MLTRLVGFADGPGTTGHALSSMLSIGRGCQYKALRRIGVQRTFRDYSGWIGVF